MGSLRVACFSLIVILSYLSLVEANKKLVCYYGSWATYRTGNGKFDVENIDPFICTHVVYSFIGLTNSGEINVLDSYLELSSGRNNFKKFTDLKKVNPDLKVLVAIGGWNEGSIKYSNVFRDSAKRRIFLESVIRFIQEHKFDGLDLDWEYPGQRGGSSNDVDNFTLLIKELKSEFVKYGYLLTAAVAAAESSFQQSYDVPALSQYLDFINLMEYDFHGSWESVVGHNSPLHMAAAEHLTHNAQLNVHASVQAWIKHGASPEKLIMGIGLYGQSFTLSSQSCIKPRCAASGPGQAGIFTQQAGFLGYNEICLMKKNNVNSLDLWDDEAKVPYLVSGNQWTSYDNEESIQIKVEYIKKYNLGGGMVWSIETDDFRGNCGKGKNPLLSKLKNGLINSTDSSTTTNAPSSSTTTTTKTTITTTSTTTQIPTTSTSSSVEPSEICKKEGFNRDPTDCRVFYQCSIVNDRYNYSKFVCSPGLVFDTNLNVCNYQSQVDCNT